MDGEKCIRPRNSGMDYRRRLHRQNLTILSKIFVEIRRRVINSPFEAHFLSFPSKSLSNDSKSYFSELFGTQWISLLPLSIELTKSLSCVVNPLPRSTLSPLSDSRFLGSLLLLWINVAGNGALLALLELVLLWKRRHELLSSELAQGEGKSFSLYCFPCRSLNL